jgi:hypothetical protein
MVADDFEFQRYNLPILAPHSIRHIVDLILEAHGNRLREIQRRSQTAAHRIAMALTGSGRSETQPRTRPPETIGLRPPRTGARIFTNYGDRLVSARTQTLANDIGDRETQRPSDLRKKLAILSNDGFLDVCP